MTKLLSVLTLLAAMLPMPAFAQADLDEAWNKIRASVFKDRPISEQSASILELETPVRAEDAATVPIAIRTRQLEDGVRIQRLYLIIDHNPSPMGAVFSFYPDSGRADIETRVRIEDYSMVRAIAELSDGRLFMAAHYVKAAGGCSAPAGKDQAAAMARMGRIKFRVEGEPVIGQPTQAQLMISHPNNSGLVKDQVTMLYVPPRFVRRVDVSYAGKPVLTADIDFTISENPNFRFYFVPREAGELKAEIVDTNDLHFESSIAVRKTPAQ
jgi:sulfur-oxidizing protein SoxY